DAVRATLAEGRGVVLVTGHFGNWEITGATLAANGLPMDVVIRSLTNRRLDRYVREVRTRLGMRVIDRTSAWDRLLARVRAGRIVGLAADQDAHRDGVFVPFFGQLASTHRAPALLAIRGGATLFVVGVRRVGPRRYEFWCKRLDVAGPRDVREHVLELTRGWMGELERQVRVSPEQYFWHHRRWKTRPPGTEAVGAGISSGQVSQ
ncbi:MAG: lysophospholipid acyltransferase family protein, partial [Gemmatimonadales bacterium]